MDDGKATSDDDTARPPATPPGRRGDRATYLEQLSARILRAAERALKDKPEPLAQLSSLIGELIIELRRVEENCRNLEQQLEALTVRHRDLLDRVPIPCFITNEEDTVTDANREALLLLRSSERHMLGKPPTLWFRDRRAAEQLLKDLRAGTGPVHRQLDVAPRDRRPAPMTIIVQQVDGVTPALWRWFLLPDPKAARQTSL